MLWSTPQTPVPRKMPAFPWIKQLEHGKSTKQFQVSQDPSKFPSTEKTPFPILTGLHPHHLPMFPANFPKSSENLHVSELFGRSKRCPCESTSSPRALLPRFVPRCSGWRPMSDSCGDPTKSNQSPSNPINLPSPSPLKVLKYPHRSVIQSPSKILQKTSKHHPITIFSEKKIPSGNFT